MNFGMLPPELNSALMYAGAGSASLAAADAAWATLSSDLANSATGFSTTIAALGATWLGPSSVAMMASAATHASQLTTLAEQAAQTSASVQGVAAAYQAAFAATVPPPVIVANRVQLATLVATNILGQNTPAIMATEAQYVEMWAQDAAAMYGYQSSSSAALAALPLFNPPASTTTGVQSTSATNIFAPGSDTATDGVAGLLNLLSGTTGSSFGSFLNSTLLNTVASSAFFNPGESYAPVAGLLSILPAFAQTGLQQQQTSIQQQQTYLQQLQNEMQALEGGYPPGSFNGVGEPITPVQASAGAAESVGALTVPPSWSREVQPPMPLRGATPMVTEEARPFPAMVPPLIAASAGGKSERPRYGFPVRVVEKEGERKW